MSCDVTLQPRRQINVLSSRCFSNHRNYCQEVKDLNKVKQILKNFYEHMNYENKQKFTRFIVKKEKSVN